MIDFTTSQGLPEAIENISSRTPIGRALTSKEWSLVPAELRMRAMFSARVEEVRYLVSMQDKLEQRVRLARENGTLMNRARFIAEMQDDLRQFGYEPDPDKRGSMQDLSSAGRLGLIWEMNLAMAEGHAAWKTGMDPDLLDAAPAQELVRVANRFDKRPWPEIWRKSGGEFYGEPSADFPDAPGRMMALKTDIIWSVISEFGTPWPPFRWGSGVGLRNVRRREAEQLGVIKPTTRLTPLDQPFNADAKASLAGIPEDRRQSLKEEFLGDVEVDGDTLKMLPPDKYDDSSKGSKKLPSVSYSQEDQPGPQGEMKITNAFRIGLTQRITAPKVSGQVKQALEAVSEIHTIPEIKLTPIRIQTMLGRIAGRYVRASSPSYVVINPNAHSISMTVWHELAHVLDHRALHGYGERIFASEGQPTLRQLMREIRQSVAVSRLYDLANANGQTYWIQEREIFARAYSQWIATETQDESALQFIRDVRLRKYEVESIWKDTQWTQADFRQIRKAFRALFRLPNPT